MTNETTSIKSASLAETSSTNSTKRKRTSEIKYYAVRVGHQPGIYHTWTDCLEQVKGFKKATCESGSKDGTPKLALTLLVKSFPTLIDAERFVAGENPSPSGSQGSSPPPKFYAVKSGRRPGIYTDWPSAQAQITGWQKPKHRCFSTRFEAQRFLNENEARVTENASESDANEETFGLHHTSDNRSGSNRHPLAQKMAKSDTNGADTAKSEQRDGDFEPGTGPLPPDAEDGFDPDIMLDPQTGKLVYKSWEQRQAMKLKPSSDYQTEPIRVHTDGSSLRNGRAGAYAGVGVYFGPGDKR